MADRQRFVVALGYGRCIEAIKRVEEAYWRAAMRGDRAECAALLQERAEWVALRQVTPRFVHELEAARG